MENTKKLFEEAIEDAQYKYNVDITPNCNKEASESIYAIHKSECVKLLNWYDNRKYEDASPEYYEKIFNQFTEETKIKG